MLVSDLVTALDSRIPLRNAADWDPVGIQLGWPDRDVGRIAVAHEVTDGVVDACRDSGIGTLIAYHPLLFAPTTALVEGATPEGRALALIEAGVSLIVVHTAFDASTPGTADAFLAALGVSTAGVWAAEAETPDVAIGRLGELAEPVTPDQLGERVSELTGREVRLARAERPISTIAVLPGSGGSWVAEAATIADALITGDVRHHTATAAVSAGLTIVDAGHAATERPGVEALYAVVCEEGGDAILLGDDPTPWEA